MTEPTLSDSMASAAEKIQEIVDAAERVAGDIRREAEVDAERYLEQRRRDADRLTVERARELQQLSANLAGQAELVRRQAEELIRTIDATVADLTAAPAGQDGEDDEVDALDGGVPEPHLTVAPDISEADETPVADPRDPGDAAMRAAQLAAAGHGRTEIVSVIRAEFGIAHPGPLVDDVLGA